MPGDSNPNQSHTQISHAAAKWYMPVATELVRSCELHPLEKDADALEAVRRSDRPAIAFPALVSPKPVLGRDPLDLKAIFFAPLVVRLHYVAQLSTTYLRGNVDAKHCRLSHALGSLSVLSVLIHRVAEQLKDDTELNKFLPDGHELTAAFTYAAIHDAFQGPFGHVLDALRVDLLGVDRRLDKTLLYYMCSQALAYDKRENIEPPTAVIALCEILEAAIARPLGVPLRFILEWIAEASDRNPILTVEQSTRRSQLRWLYELLEGPLDADRWDYLWRDTLHLGLRGHNEAIISLFQRFSTSLSVGLYSSELRLVVTSDMARDLAEHFFELRRDLYREIYESPEKRLIDAMLIRAIYLGLMDRHPMSLTVKIDLMNITDAELLAVLETASHPLAVHLARELRTFPLMYIVWRYPIGQREVASAMSQTDVVKEFQYNGTMPPRWADQDEELKEVLAKNYQKLSSIQEIKRFMPFMGRGSYLFAISALLHCSIFSTRAARLLHLERIIWRIVYREIDNSTREGIAESISVRLGQPNADLRLLLQQCPPIFLSFPWLSLASADAVREIARDSGQPTICVQEGDEILEKTPGALMAESSGEGGYPPYTIVAGYPQFFVSRLSENDRQTLNMQIERAIERVIGSGCCLALPQDYLTEAHEREIANFILSVVPNEPQRTARRR